MRSTPAQLSKVSHRRESSFFTSTPLQPRPPSVISDSGTDTMDIPKKKVSRDVQCRHHPPKFWPLEKYTSQQKWNSIDIIFRQQNHCTCWEGQFYYGSTYFEAPSFDRDSDSYTLGDRSFTLTNGDS